MQGSAQELLNCFVRLQGLNISQVNGCANHKKNAVIHYFLDVKKKC